MITILIKNTELNIQDNLFLSDIDKNENNNEEFNINKEPKNSTVKNNKFINKSDYRQYWRMCQQNNLAAKNQKYKDAYQSNRINFEKKYFRPKFIYQAY